MFLFFGLGKQTVKELGKVRRQYCGHCQKTETCVLVKVTDWFTFFFVPIFPYMTRYALICPLCDHAREVSREELSDILGNLKPMAEAQTPDGQSPDSADSAETGDDGKGENESGGWFFGGEQEMKSLMRTDDDKYVGKNPTQIAYLAKLEAHEKARAAAEGKEAGDGRAKRDAGEEADGGNSSSIQERVRALDARERALDVREKALTDRERALRAREEKNGRIESSGR